MSDWRRWRRAASTGVVLGMVGSVAAGCGGGGSKGGPAGATTTSSSASLVKRLEVEVASDGAALVPRPTTLAQAGELVGWPALAEAAGGIAGCTVGAQGVTPVTTNAQGKAVLLNVPVPNTVRVDCGAQGGTASFPVQSSASQVNVKVRAKANRIEVKSKDEVVSKVSQPSPPDVSPQVSPPKVSRSGSGSGSSGSGNSGSGKSGKS